MRKRALLVTLGLLSLGAGAIHAESLPLQIAQRMRANPRIQITYEFIEYLNQGKFDQAQERLYPAQQSEQPGLPSPLEEFWRSLLQQNGQLKRVQVIGTEQVGGFDTVLVEVRFTQATRKVQLFFNAQNQIQLLTVVPEYPVPSYARLDSLTETTVMIKQGNRPALPGTLTVPKGKGPFPAVVLVHGSGPGDRDETLGPIKPFRDLAWGLASQGIAVLRYDKRTLVYPQQFVGRFTVKEETIDDAIAAVQLLRQTARIDPRRIFVLGHSLGGMLIPRIGQHDPKLAGLMILAGNTRPFENLFLDQTRYLVELDGVTSPEEQSALATTEKLVAQIKSPDLAEASPTQMILGAPPSYWLDLREYRPAIAAQNLNQRLLILQGERDYQVTMTDFRGWQVVLQQRPTVTFKTYPRLNHFFMPGEGKSSPAEYAQPNHVAQDVIDDLARWIKAQ